MIGQEREGDKIKNQGVDKIERVEVVEEKGEGNEEIEKFEGGEYRRKILWMQGGEEFEVRMVVNKEVVGVIGERFGEDIFIVKEKDNELRLSGKISIRSEFYGWVLGVGGGVKML